MVRGGEVLIVSGPPGSGKTTVAKALAAEADRSVHLESDWFYRFISSGFVGPHLPEAHTQNTAVTDIVIDAAAGYAEAGYVVVWDGVVGPWFLDRIVARLAARPIRVHYLVLRPDRETALERVRQRDGTTEVSGAATMYDQFANLGEFERHVVSSNTPLDQVLTNCRAALADDELVVAADAWVDDRWPVSVKGVLGWDGQVVVLRNERAEWELPGGRLEAGDASPEAALRRELHEELGVEAIIGPLVDSWIYEVVGKRVLILTYSCEAPRPAVLSYSSEHLDVALLRPSDLAESNFPKGYLRSVRAAT